MSQDHCLSEEEISYYATLGVSGFLDVLSVLRDDCFQIFDTSYTASMPCEYILESFVFAKEELHGWWPVFERISHFPEVSTAEIGLMLGTFNELLNDIERKEFQFMCTLPSFN